MGFANSFAHIPLEAVSLELYYDGVVFATFISYLQARGAMRGHQVKHISLARKVVDYLQSGASAREASQIRSHAQRLDLQLQRLEAQVSASAPRATKGALPDCAAVHEWVDAEVDFAIRLVIRDFGEFGKLSIYGAEQVHRALIASLITGR